MLLLEVNFMGLYFRVELFSWTHGARKAKSTSSYVAIQKCKILEYPQNGAFYCFLAHAWLIIFPCIQQAPLHASTIRYTSRFGLVPGAPPIRP